MSLKIFLTALAIIDDLGAILVIAIFYGNGIQFTWILASMIICGIILFLNHRDYTFTWLYTILGISLWFCMLHSGIHATIAGVIFAFLLPRQSQKEGKMSDAFEHFLQIPVSYFVLPLFAIANTAISIDAQVITELFHPLPLGIFIGLLIGKPLGIFCFCWIANKLNLASISKEISLMQLLAAGILGGIGFTMSIFIVNLAFDDLHLIQLAKISVLFSSTLAALFGFLIFKNQ
jgi:NhaA family Na+:H+ antiporter